MNRQYATTKRQKTSQGTAKNTLVRDVVAAFTLLGLTAVLLMPLPALGENSGRSFVEAGTLETSQGIAENPVLPRLGRTTALTPLAHESFEAVPTDQGESATSPEMQTDNETPSATPKATTPETVTPGEDAAQATPDDNASEKSEASTAPAVSDETESPSSSETTSEAPSNPASDTTSDEPATSPDQATEDKNPAVSENASIKEPASAATDESADDAGTDSSESTNPLVDSLEGFGPEAPLYTEGYALRTNDDAQPAYTVTFSPNGGGGTSVSYTTTTGNVALPTPEQVGFTAPDGALFVGWSPSSSGYNPVYAAEVMYPDNADHTAVLKGNTTLYAIWLKPGSATDRDTAYYFIRMDGKIPFEPSGYSGAHYIPSGSNPALTGELNWGISITNNLEAVAANLYSQPSDEEIQAAMERQGKTFDPATQEVVWYVIKVRRHKVWNVDGAIIDKADHLVSYSPNGGNSNVPVTEAYKTDATVNVSFTTVPDRFGYTFLGWDEDANATTPTYTASGTTSFAMPDRPVTLHAIWEKSTVQLTYVAEPTEAGSVSNEVDEVYALDGAAADGSTLQGSTATASPGYLFEGWYKTDSAGNETLVTAEETLTAQEAVQAANHQHGVLLPTVYVAHFIKVEPAFTLEKAVENEPANGAFFAEGETVTYAVTVTNTGNVSLENITFKDNLAEVPSLASLAVDETQTVTYNYVVTGDDTKADVLTNTVEATATAAELPDETVTAEPATTSTFVGTLLPDQTYVLFTPYPADDGTVQHSYNIVNSTTGEGIEENTAEAKSGYDFDGWYKEGEDTFITKSATLTADQIMEHMNRGKGRTTYGPTLFVAHFTPTAATPDVPAGGGNSGAGGDTTTPDTPSTPDTPTTPTTPDKPSTGDTGNNSGTGSSTTNPDTSTKPSTPTEPEKPATTPQTPTTPGTSSGSSTSGSNGATNNSGTASAVQTPENELGSNETQAEDLSPVTAEGITPTDVPASSIKAEDVDPNAKLAQTDDFALAVLLPALLGIAGLAALILAALTLARKAEK